MKILDISAVHIHEQFIENEAYYDIAILETAPIQLSFEIRPICLPSSDKSNFDNDAVHLTGWGSNFELQNPSNVLQRVVLTVYPQR